MNDELIVQNMLNMNRQQFHEFERFSSQYPPYRFMSRADFDRFLQVWNDIQPNEEADIATDIIFSGQFRLDLDLFQDLFSMYIFPPHITPIERENTRQIYTRIYVGGIYVDALINDNQDLVQRIETNYDIDNFIVSREIEKYIRVDLIDIDRLSDLIDRLHFTGEELGVILGGLVSYHTRNTEIDELIMNPSPPLTENNRDIYYFLLDRGAIINWSPNLLDLAFREPPEYDILKRVLDNVDLFNMPDPLSLFWGVRVVLRIFVLRDYDNLACDLFDYLRNRYQPNIKPQNSTFLTGDGSVDRILLGCVDRTTLSFKASRSSHLHPSEKYVGEDYPRELYHTVKEAKPWRQR